MIEMKLIRSSTNPAENILELRIKAPASAEPTPTPVEKIPTLIYIDDSVDENQLPMITHALTDTINRVTWANQIRIVATRHKLPDHLVVELISKQDIFERAQTFGHCKLLLITNETTQEVQQKIARASEFLTTTSTIQPTTTIELIDDLNDHIKDLKQKTLVNLKIEIELPSERDDLESLNYIPNLTKVGRTYFANLIDLASEEEKAYAFKTGSPGCKAEFELDDLVLARAVSGGQRISIETTN
jgi:hypothetical protein